MPLHSTSASVPRRPASMPRVAAATMVGSAIEAFDFIAYGTATALVFDRLFFPGSHNATAHIAAFAAFATGFFARPVGGLIFGHFGDRLGRKKILTLSLIMMGIATFLIGMLPTYGQIGVWAPVLIVVLRIVQGLSLGGELTGAMLMAVEHAPPGRRSFFGSLPQAGTPIGVLLSTGAFALTTAVMSKQAFLDWGWRLPFLASAVLVGVGLFIRMSVDETPAFEEMKSARKVSPFPARDVILEHWKPLLLVLGAKTGEVALYYSLVTFSVSYAIGTLGFSSAHTLQAVMIGAFCQVFTIPLLGWLGDRFGSRRVFMCGAALMMVMQVPLFLALGSGSLMAFTLAVVAGLAVNYASLFAPQTDLYSAQFPAEIRYSGVALGIQAAAAIGGGLAPILAVTLVAAFGSLVPVGLYLTVLAAIALGCAWCMRDPRHDHG